MFLCNNPKFCRVGQEHRPAPSPRSSFETRAEPPLALICQPISRPLGAPIRPIAADNVLRLRRLTHRNPRSRHAGITGLVARMILTIRHDILGPVWVVL